MRQGGFSADQQQRIRVLTDGSIQFKRVEEAIRKIFGDTVDEAPPGRIYWGEEDWDYDDEARDYLFDPATGIYYQNDGALNQDFGCHVLANGDQGWSYETYYGSGAEEDVFADLLEMDEAGEVYVCLQGRCWTRPRPWSTPVI